MRTSLDVSYLVYLVTEDGFTLEGGVKDRGEDIQVGLGITGALLVADKTVNKGPYTRKPLYLLI